MNICKINKPLSINSDIFQDHRGFFSKLWQGKASWIKQINISQTKKKGSFRGIHGSFSQSEVKMVTCVSGKILDIAVNLKPDDKDFGKVYYHELFGPNQSFVIPKGYGHAFQALTDDCTIIYNHNIIYDPSDQLNVSVQSPLFNIQLPLPVTLTSDKDRDSMKITDMIQIKDLIK